MVAGNDRWAVLRNVVKPLHPRPPDDSQNWADQDPLEEPVEHVTSRDVCEPHRSWQPPPRLPGSATVRPVARPLWSGTLRTADQQGNVSLQITVRRMTFAG